MNNDVHSAVGSITFTVTQDMTAMLEGKTIHKVCSTYSLCYFAEVAARRAIEPYFEPNENAIGALVEIKHTQPAPVGAELTVNAAVTEVKGKKIICDITILCGAHTVATGKQIQIVLPDKDINALIENAYQNLAQHS